MAIVASGQMTLSDLNDSKQLIMYIGASQSRMVIYNGVSTYTPNYGSTNNVLTPQLFIAGTPTDVASGAVSTKWYYQLNGAGVPTEITASGTDYTLTGTNLKTLTLKTNLLTANTTITYICELVYPDPNTGFNITSKAQIEIVKVTNGIDGQGSNAIMGVLSNETHTLPADSAGTVSTFAGAVSTLTIYNGATDDTANWTITQTRSNVTVTEATSSATATVTAISADTGSVTFTATRSGYSNIVKIFTLTKAKGGANGTTPTAYWLVTPSAIQKDKTGAYNPATITVDMKSQTGTGTPAFYGGKIIIADSPDGTTFTDRYTSGSNEATAKSYTPSAGMKALRVRLYQAGVTPNGTVNMIDEQIIPIVSDGVDSVYAYVWTPNGNAIRNSAGTVQVQADLYSGSSTVTPTAFKWYVQDPSATTVSGGDTDGGNGWRLDITPSAPTTAPTLGTGGAGGTIAGATYYVRYTWVNASGETVANTTEANRVHTANTTLTIQVPSFPAGVYKARVYVGTVTGTANLKYQGEILTSGGTLTLNAPINTTNPIAPVAFTGMTGNTTATITVGASTIAGQESFKCVATYNTVKYSGVATAVDLSDPILVRIDGIDTFKNGVGTTTLRATLLQNGAEIDSGGTLYIYTWSLYDSSNVKIATALGGSGTALGKSIVVDGNDFVGRANIMCDVSPK